MICANHLLVLYRAYAFRVGARIKLVEQAVSCPAEVAQLSDDERRNEPATYGALFSSECQWLLEELYQKALLMMRGRPLVDCDEALNGLVFLQEMAATAPWKYRCSVRDTLASFAREFDRLDVPVERERLYARAQTTDRE